MLELLERREDEHFEGFCKALEANDQAGIVKRHLQQHRVRFIVEYSTPVWNITVIFCTEFMAAEHIVNLASQTSSHTPLHGAANATADLS